MQPQAEMMSNLRNFMRSRVILTAAELDLFTSLDRDPASAGDLAAKLGLDERAATRILDCLITFGLLEKVNGRYRPTEKGSYLSSRHPRSFLPSALHAVRLWNNWSHLTAAVKEGVNPHLELLSDKAGSKDQKAFIGSMHVGARALSSRICDVYDTSRFTRLLDIGGGSGAYAIAFLEKNPQLSGVVFDLDGVIPIAEEKVGEAGLQDRVTFTTGDYNRDALPGGCDLAFLSAVIHQNSPEQNLRLFRKIYSVLEPGGSLLIRDHFMDATRTKPPMGALFALNMLVCTSGGDTYTLDEVKDSLAAAGFENAEMIRAGERMDSLVEAVKPE